MAGRENKYAPRGRGKEWWLGNDGQWAAPGRPTAGRWTRGYLLLAQQRYCTRTVSSQPAVIQNGHLLLQQCLCGGKYGKWFSSRSVALLRKLYLLCVCVHTTSPTCIGDAPAFRHRPTKKGATLYPPVVPCSMLHGVHPKKSKRKQCPKVLSSGRMSLKHPRWSKPSYRGRDQINPSLP